jgi:hypothetical protein
LEQPVVGEIVIEPVNAPVSVEDLAEFQEELRAHLAASTVWRLRNRSIASAASVKSWCPARKSAAGGSGRERA